MAPTEAVDSPKAGSPKAKAGEQVKDAGPGDGYHSDSLPRMTPELLQAICKERQMWTQPHLNTQLFLNYKGFLRIEGLEDYVNVRSLHLDNNNISKIEGLDRMTDLRSLHLAGNRIKDIENLESNIELRHLNLEANAIRYVSGVRQLAKLETLNLSGNRFEELEDLSNLKDLPALANVDVSSNSIEAADGVVDFWSEFKNLKVLRFHGNPGVRHVSHYRKLIINALPSLSYMDERPVFAVERKASQAWAEGGMTAMHEAKREFHRQRHAANAVDPERRELVTQRRNMAIERIEREKREREEKEKERSEKTSGNAAALDAGDIEALMDYGEGWKKKVNMYGVDGVREKVAKEMNGSSWSKAQSATSTSTSAQQHFEFAPPRRAETVPVEPETMAATPASGRRQERPPVDVSSFRVSAVTTQLDNTDRQFSVLPDDVEVSLRGSSDGHEVPAKQGARQAAAQNTPVMPLIWEQRQAENIAAEATCLEQNFEIARRAMEDVSSPAAFRSDDLTGLD